MRRLSKDAVRAGVALLTAAALFASVLSLGARTERAEAGNFAITEITANCNGSGLVSYTGTLPQGGFTLSLMDKAPDDSGPFMPTSPPTVITITSGDSPVAYTMPLGNWSPPHYRVDSNFSTKSPSLSCGAIATDTPQATATQTRTVTPTASASRTPAATASPTASATAPAGSTRTSTAVVTATASPGGPSGSGAAPTASPSAAAVNTVLALVQPRSGAARLPSALPNTGGSGASAAWTRAVLPPALGVLALGLLAAVSGGCYRSAFVRRNR